MTSIVLTEAQQDAVDMVEALMYTIGYQAAVLRGYAGTGKTTVLGFIDKQLAGRIPGIMILTPTGKAAVRIKELTGIEASTIHKWLYVSKTDKNGKPRFSRKSIEELSQKNGYLFIIDESSMVGGKLWEELEYTFKQMGNVKVLLVGDGFQLPPITTKDESAMCALDIETPLKTELVEVQRQALKSPVIEAATKIRNGGSISCLPGILNWVMPEDFEERVVDAWEGGAAVIVHTNDMRMAINELIRNKKGFKDLTIGEPLLILKNNYTLNRYNGEVGIYGGSVGKYPYCSGIANTILDADQKVDFDLVEVDGQQLLICPDQIAGKLDDITPYEIEECASRAWQKCKGNMDVPFLHCTYGYALTAHKAQGSEWDDVFVVVEPTIKSETEIGRRFLYTAITRAKNNADFIVLSWDSRRQFISKILSNSEEG